MYMYTEAILSNSTRKLHVMVCSYQHADCSLKNKFIVLFSILFGTLSFAIASTSFILSNKSV